MPDAAVASTPLRGNLNPRRSQALGRSSRDLVGGQRSVGPDVADAGRAAAADATAGRHDLVETRSTLAWSHIRFLCATYDSHRLTRKPSCWQSATEEQHMRRRRRETALRGFVNAGSLQISGVASQHLRTFAICPGL